MSGKEHEDTPWDNGNTLYLLLGVGCMGVYIGKNSSSCTLKTCEFYVCKLFLNKNELFKNLNSYRDINIHMG